jgi:hypothetical protein
MKTKLLLIESLIFLTLCVIFASCWNKIYDGGPDEQKGDYVFFCLKITVLLVLFYSVMTRLSIPNLFPILLLFILPLLNCIVSVILALVISLLSGDTGDTSILQVYLFVHGFTAVGFVYLFRYLATKKNAGTGKHQ